MGVSVGNGSPGKTGETNVSQYSTRRTTSVLYDFSTVEKARFYVYSILAHGIKVGALEDTLYVQINPSNISVSSDAARRVTKPAAGDGNVATLESAKKDNYGVDDMVINLRYDLYDEFMVSTMDGMIPSDKHLKSADAASMERLIEIARMDNKAVLFKWGPIEYFGSVNKAEFNYTAFSRFGYPLKADGSVTLRALGYKIATNGEIIYPQDEKNSAIRASIQGLTDLSSKLLRVELGATQALR